MDEERNNCRKRSCYQDNCIEYEHSKRRNFNDQREKHDLKTEYTVYRYLCLKRKAGHVIGRGGEIMKHIRLDTGARVLIEDAVLGCEERIVTISSSSKETNPFNYKKDYVCPAQDALFRVHERLIEDEPPDYNEVDSFGALNVTARLLITSDQARCIIGRQGFTIKNMRIDTGARIFIWNDDHVPICADRSEELLEPYFFRINGDALAVKEALFQVSCLVHEHPSRLHDQISSNISYNPSGYCFSRDSASKPYSPVEDSYEFTLRLVCPSVNIRDVIGKSGTNINLIRQQSGATINLDCFFEEEDCLILISAKEYLGTSNSPTVNAATQLQPCCSKKVESDCDRPSYVTRLLVRRSQVGGLIGKAGAVIKDIRRTAHASISIIEESLPSVASMDDAMVQISGDLFNVRNALIQVIDRLKASHFGKKGLLSAPSSASSHYIPRNSSRRSGCSDRWLEPHCQGHSNYSKHNAWVPFEICADTGGSKVEGDD